MKRVNNIYLVLILLSLLVILIINITNGFGMFHNYVENFQSKCETSKKEKKKLKKKSNKNLDKLKELENSVENITPNISPDISSDISSDITDAPVSASDIEKIMNEDNIEEVFPSPSIEDMTYLEEIENKDLVINDFFPSRKLVNKKSKEEILKFSYSTDLFHQILPVYKKGHIGLISFDKRINGLYYTDNLDQKKWELIPNSMPSGMLKPVFLTYDRDRKLLGIFEEANAGDYIISKYHLYKKKNLGLGCMWEHIERSRITSMIFDDDERLIGLDNDGNFYKKTNKKINSNWDKMELNFEHIPMRKLIYNKDNLMYGLGTDFRIYKKSFIDWKNNEWSEPSPKSLLGSVRDIFYDYDDKLCGLSRIGLVKEINNEDTDVLDFEIYNKYKDEVISNKQVLYCVTGIKHFPSYNNNDNNINEEIIDGKKLSDYKFKDPKLNEFIKFRMNLKKKCNRIKNLKLVEDIDKEDENELRNQKFEDILEQQKDTIDNLMDTIETLKKGTFINQ